MITNQTCARCGKQAPPMESNAFLDWEALGDGSAVCCPDCLTADEQQAIDEADMELTAEVEVEELDDLFRRS